VVDPGPPLDPHVQALIAEVSARGGLGGVALTHDHSDHAGAVPALLDAHPAPLAAGGGHGDVALSDGSRFGPFEALASPGHAPDHHVLIAAGVCFSGDAVLGAGSVFISPHPGAMAGYLRALERLRARGDIELICPGHGEPVADPQRKLAEYIEHRRERERRLRAALADGLRGVEELLDRVWDDAPPALRPAASLTLAAHLDKLAEEGALPAGVERPARAGASP
jgi:glyoxylase-like metal-dependent hydrolase (beta-lactamase superfamily II)